MTALLRQDDHGVIPAAHSKTVPSAIVAVAKDWTDFELLDTGDGKKLERYGKFTIIRPEPSAMWRPASGEAAWKRADAEFIPSSESGGNWRFAGAEPGPWQMRFRDLAFRCRFTSFRHLGIFPEQSPQWDWMRALLGDAKSPARVLNLFGYTGAASLVAARAGAKVTHVDSSKKAIAWALENKNLNQGDELNSIRWLCDDAVKFVRREHRRNAQYEGIILDPPKFGRGPKGEVWKLNNDLPELLRECRSLLSDRPLFVLLTAYSIQASPLHLYYLMQEILSDRGGHLECGELALQERSAGRILPTAQFCRWSRSDTGTCQNEATRTHPTS
jgi:23S rRNA (cytosine1962-C5)-methyltransferase